MAILRTVTDLFIVQREGLKNRKWHRLANVLIYGSTVAVFLWQFLPLENLRGYSIITPNYGVIGTAHEPTAQDISLMVFGTTSLPDTLSNEQMILASQVEVKSPWEKVRDVFANGVLNALVWFVFWQSIIYRAVVYVILGREKK